MLYNIIKAVIKGKELAFVHIEKQMVVGLLSGTKRFGSFFCREMNNNI